MHNQTTICLHAWKHTDQDEQTYADPADGPVDGWCVYRRIETPANASQPFDIVEDEDFTDEGAARERAAALATEFGCEVQEY